MRSAVFLLYVFFLSFSLFSQTKTDPLFGAIHAASDDQSRLAAITALAPYYFNIHRDSLDKYAYEAVALVKEQTDPLLKAKALLLLAQDYFRWGWTDSCIHTANTALAFCQPNQPATAPTYFELQRIKALSYGVQNNFQAALAILYKIVSEAETRRYYLSAALNCNSIGSLALNGNNAREALFWIRKAMSFPQQGTDVVVEASCFINLSMAYKMLDRKDSAIYYIEKALPLALQSENLNVITTAFRVKSAILLNEGKNVEAEDALKKMIAYREKSGDANQYIDDNLLLADFYMKSNQLPKAIALCTAALQVGERNAFDTAMGAQTFINNITNRLAYHQKLAECYKLSGDKKAYAGALENIIAAKDTLYRQNSERALAEMKTKYEVQEKENTILQQRLGLVKRTSLSVISIVLLVVAVTVFLLLIKRNRLRHRRRVTEAEENERKRIAADLHDNLGVQANAILYTSELLKQGENTDGTLVSNMNQTAKDMLFFLRETLWALKSADTTTTQLWFRILNFYKQMQRNYPNFEFATEGIADKDLPISSARALNILMIVQEATNNCIKHSKGTRIKISSQFENNQWQITVADDGTGFNITEAGQKEESNGLKNMQQRADSSHIQLQIMPQKSRGTTVQLLVAVQ